MFFRTDLALECREALEENSSAVFCEEEQKGKLKITRIEVKDERTAREVGKPRGRYITIELPPFSDDPELFDGRVETAAEELRKMLPDKGLVLVAGLGNRAITPDALGPLTINGIVATRHLSGELLKSVGLEGMRPVAALAPGVLGETGMEVNEITQSLARQFKPSAVIVVDALASRSLSRLGCTVQMSDAGIEPGAGVGNRRKEISKNTLGVPVIAVGVPTVVDAATLAFDLTHTQESEIKKQTQPNGMPMMVTPREIDLLVERAAKLLALTINSALQPTVSPQDLSALIS